MGLDPNSSPKEVSAHAQGEASEAMEALQLFDSSGALEEDTLVTVLCEVEQMQKSLILEHSADETIRLEIPVGRLMAVLYAARVGLNLRIASNMEELHKAELNDE